MADRVIEIQSSSAGHRRNPINKELKGILQQVGEATDVYFEVYSGSQTGKGASKPHGAGPAHNDGQAADLKIFVKENGSKRYLNMTKESDQPLLTQVVGLGRSLGLNGLGAGPNYMGAESFHLDVYGDNFRTWGTGQTASGKWTTGDAYGPLEKAFAKGVPIPPGIIPGPAPIPADRSESIRLAQIGADDPGIGTAFSQLERFGQGPAPVTMSDALAYSSGRLQDVPLPRDRPVGPVADVAMPRARPATPVAAPPLPSAFPGLSRGIVDSVQSPTLFSEGVGIPNNQIPGSDATYSGANRMSAGGLGALLDPRSFSPATPNPTVPSSLPQSSRTTAPIGPIGMTGTPGYVPSPPASSSTSSASSWSGPPVYAPASPPPPAGNVKTTGGIAGTVQLPRDVRPNVPEIGLPSSTMSSMGFSEGTVPKYITKTIQVPNPDYKQVNPGNPTLAAMGFSPGTMPTIPKTIPKTIQVPNPAFVAPVAPIPATQSAGLLAMRSVPQSAAKSSSSKSSGTSAADYAAANSAAKAKAIANSSNPSKNAARASLAAQWGFD